VGLFAQLPWLRPLHRAGQWALFCDLFTLLLEHQVSWSDSLRLAADAMGESPVRMQLHRLAEQAQQGRTLAAGALRATGAPGLLRILLSPQLPAPDAVAALRVLAKDLRRHVAYRSDQIRQWLPLGLTLFVVGPAVCAYGVLMLGPWFWQLTEIVNSTS